MLSLSSKTFLIELSKIELSSYLIDKKTLRLGMNFYCPYKYRFFVLWKNKIKIDIKHQIKKVTNKNTYRDTNHINNYLAQVYKWKQSFKIQFIYLV